MNYSGLITIGSALAGHLTAPDAPKIDAYNPEKIEKKELTDYLSNIDQVMTQQADLALSMMSGDLPSAVVDEINMLAGEAAQRGGFGASTTRTGNLQARDLGLSALDMMERGTDLGNYLVNMTRQLRSDDMSIDITNANMAFDAWASNAEARMGAWRGESAQHANLWGAIGEGLSGLATSYYQDGQTKTSKAKAAKSSTDYSSVHDDFASSYDNANLGGWQA